MISGGIQEEDIDFKVIFRGWRPSSDHSEGKDHVREVASTQPTFSLQHYRCRNNGVTLLRTRTKSSKTCNIYRYRGFETCSISVLSFCNPLPLLWWLLEFKAFDSTNPLPRRQCPVDASAFHTARKDILRELPAVSTPQALSRNTIPTSSWCWLVPPHFPPDRHYE